MDQGSSISNPVGSAERTPSTFAPDLPDELQDQHRERLESVVADPNCPPSKMLGALLDLGTELLNVENGHLCRINPGLDRHTVVHAVGPGSYMREGDTTAFSSTFCRAVVTSSEPVLLHDAPNQGWENDVAYETFGIRRYLGAKVLRGNKLFGTVCFTDSTPAADAFTVAEAELLHALSQQIEYALHKGRGSAPSLTSRAQLEREYTLLQRAQDLSQIGGWEFDVESEELHWTDNMYDIYELPQDHVPTVESALRYFEDDAQSELRKALDRCIADGTTWDRDLRLTTAQGNRRWVRVRGEPRTDNGDIVSVTGMLQDVTEQYELERQLEVARNQFRRLVENAEPIVFMTDKDGTILVSEGDDLRALNYEPGELVGENVFDVFSDVPDIQQQIERALNGESVFGNLDVRGTLLDVWHAPFEDTAGNVAGCVGMATNVTEERRTRHALRKERDLLNQIFQTSPLAIAVFNEDGDFVQVGGQSQEILGLEKEEVEKRTFKDPEWDITAPDGTPLPEEDIPFARVKATEEPVMNAEHTIEWPDGRRRLLSVNGAPLHDEDDSFVGAVFHIDDITERRQAKRKLEDSERRFRSIFENAALGIALLSDDGHFLDANAAFESMLGYDADELDGRHFNEITHPEDVDDEKRHFDEIRAGTTDRFQMEKRYLRDNGDLFWGHVTVSRLEGPEETQVIALVQDIDTRKKQRDKLRQFRKVIDQAHEAVLILQGTPREKPGPRITYANPSFGDLTGYDPDDAVGKPLGFLFGSETEPWVLENLWNALDDGERHEGEALSYRKDGTPFVNHWSIAPVYDEEDTITHWVSVLRDVTEKREMSKRLIQIQDEERRRIDKEMHDEMGGLLTTLQMTVELCRMESESGADLAERFEEMENLLSDVSSVTRTISRRLHPRVLDDHGLAAALRSLKTNFRDRHDLSVHLHNEIEDEEPLSALVEMTAFRVIQEALVNVVRHAETDVVQVLVNKVENQLWLNVIDEGVGFDSTTESGVETYGLRGIAERVEHLNGEFKIVTAPGEGARISAKLPLSISSLPTD